MTGSRLHSVAVLLHELFIQGGVYVFTSAPAPSEDSTALVTMTMIAPTGDIVVKVSRGAPMDGSLWEAHMQAVRLRLAPLYALRSWMKSSETWIVRGSWILASISTAAAVADAKGSWIERILRVVIPSAAAFVVQRYRRRVVTYVAGRLLRRYLFAVIEPA